MIRTLLMSAGALALVSCGQQAAKNETAQQQAPATQTPAAPAAPAAPAQAAMTDAEFAQTVAKSDAFEIQASQLAATHAARRDVKDFATMMVHDHRATTHALTELAQRNNLDLPTPVTITAEQQANLDALRDKTGEAFDAAYIDAQVTAHQNAVHLFETYAASASPGPLRDWANTTLPKLRDHLSRAQAVQNAT